MAVNLDRFAQGLPDPQDAKVMAECAGCGCQIYQGSRVYVVKGNILHADDACLNAYIMPDIMTVEEALGVK